MYFWPKQLAAISLLVIVWATNVLGHDLRGLGNRSLQFANQINVERLRDLSESLDEIGRYVYSRLVLWDPGQDLRACFFDGAEAEKNFVVATVKELLEGRNVNITINFGSAPNFHECDQGQRGDIRISFSQGCCAAYIGRVAHHPAIKNAPSVLLQGVLGYEAAKGRQIVMHELLHALGFNHEHQSPASSCEQEFIKEKILDAFGWGEQEFKTNLARLNQDARSYKWSGYDATSIMKYYFDASFLKNGKDSPCYYSENYLPSARDYEGLRDAYRGAPVGASGDSARAVLDAIAGSEVPDELKSLARELRKTDQ
jgi:hypothetical protein